MDLSRSSSSGAALDADAAESGPPRIEIRRSARRRRTAQARWEGERIVVMVPAGLDRAEERRIVDGLVTRVSRSGSRPPTRTDAWLEALAVRLARAHLDTVAGYEVRATSIRWVSTMSHRWGSCTIGTRRIRISDTLARAPQHVVEAVVFHELVHLLEPGHTSRFRAIERLHPDHELARNWLRGWSAGHAAASGLAPQPLRDDQDDPEWNDTP